MDDVFRKAVLAFIEKEGLVLPGDRVIVAASGGADSMALLQLLSEEKETLRLGALEAVHVDHRLRPESCRVAQFVADFCAQRNILLHRFVSDREIGHRSEEWSRDFRYGCFEQLAAPHTWIATAHTLSDQAETLLFRIARGTGVRGAGGIPAKRGPFIRPMLWVTKQQTEEFCKSRGIDYIMDQDNLTDDYARNRIRHYALPALESANPKAQQAMGGFCSRMTRLESYLNRQAQALLQRAQAQGGWKAEALLQADPVERQAAYAILVEHSRALRQTDVQQLDNLLRRGKGRLQIGPDTALCVQNKIVRLVREVQPAPAAALQPGEYELPGGYRLRVQLLIGKDCEETIKFVHSDKKLLKNCADYDKLTGSLVLRTRCGQDRFRPGGRNVDKSLKKLLNEAKVPENIRDLLPLVAQENRVLWLWGQGFAHGLRPTEQTKRLLILQPQENNKDLGEQE